MAKKAVQSLCGEIHKRCLEATASWATDLAAMIPMYEQIMSKDKINAAMAKKFVLQSPHRATLSDKTVGLFSNIATASRMQSEWGLPPFPDDSPGLDLEVAKNIFDTAKAALTVLAALKIIYELKGAPQREQCEAFLAKKRPELPALLAEELGKLISKGSSS
eukprot:16452378-Heterocapsa_arctica.AAC.2